MTESHKDPYREFIVAEGLPLYRHRQILEGVYKNFAENYYQISTLPVNLQERLTAVIPLPALKLVSQQVAATKHTVKELLLTNKEHLIESVLIQHQDGRNTVCVSCMSGCPVGCDFCATGQMGWKGNVTGGEMVEQVLRFARYLRLQEMRVTNVVFMGMGEPMLNLAAVKEAIAILTDESMFGLGKRRITVSTSGYVPQLEELIRTGYRGRIAISLHAPNQELREKLMPNVARAFPLDLLLQKMDEYVALTNKRITYEYILIAGVNDKDEHAGQLVRLFRNRLAHINLIPYNPISGKSYSRTSASRVTEFQRKLLQKGITTTVRLTMGEDIDSACGQLAVKSFRARENM